MSIQFGLEPEVWRNVSARLCAVLIGAVACAPHPHTCAQSIQSAQGSQGTLGTAPMIYLHFNDRPPYEYREGGTMKGLLVPPVEAALQRAGITYQWIETPINRQFKLLERNQGRDCLVGRFKTPQREVYARFTEAIYRDHPQLLLVRMEDSARFSSFGSIKKALQNTDFKLLLKDGYSYGASFDALIAARSGGMLRVSQENKSMLRMLDAHIADAMIVAPEEAATLIAQESDLPRRFTTVGYPDLPPGEKRYMLCSLNVPQTYIAAFNAAFPDIGD